MIFCFPGYRFDNFQKVVKSYSTVEAQNVNNHQQLLPHYEYTPGTPHQGASFVEKQMKCDVPQFIGETRY